MIVELFTRQKSSTMSNFGISGAYPPVIVRMRILALPSPLEEAGSVGDVILLAHSQSNRTSSNIRLMMNPLIFQFSTHFS
jgi:hypothetical protein